jgi:hypothetical protein
MKLDRITYHPGSVLDFYQDGLSALGALCERTWHDRLEIVAEGRAAKLWNTDGELHSLELSFAAADTSTARDASREVFPGCPLTFRLAEALRPAPIPLDRLVLANQAVERAPDTTVAEKLWRSQFPDTKRWRLRTPFQADFHFSLIAMARCEIQAIDQHWSLNRVALALPGAEPDENLAAELSFAEVETDPPPDIAWPVADPADWIRFVGAALLSDLKEDLRSIRTRQETSLRRELDRIDDYFEHYASELAARARSTGSEGVRLKTGDRLAAAKAEHERRRADQLARHEIRIRPHIDALLLVAERAWRADVEVERPHHHDISSGLFIPRARRWQLQSQPGLC